MNDGEALLRAILEHPDEDTPRLMYADWLDEHADDVVPCPNTECKSGQVYEQRQCKDGIYRNAWGDCPRCSGSGRVPARPDARDRAELIRVQCELARTRRFDPPAEHRCDVCGNEPDEDGELRHGKGCYVIDADGGGSEWVGSRQRWIDLTNRSGALLEAHPGWFPPCPACEGKGYHGTRQHHSECASCRGQNRGRAGCEFRRGFVSRIELTAADFLAHAEAIFSAHPITEVRLTDREPRRSYHDLDGNLATTGAAGWYRDGDWSAALPADLPHPMFDAMCGQRGWVGRILRTKSCLWLESEAVALAVLSSACVDVGRRKAGLSPLPVPEAAK